MMRALVTGAGKRLGRAMALYLADRGYDVAVHFASSETAAKSLVQEIIAKGREIHRVTGRFVTRRSS